MSKKGYWIANVQVNDQSLYEEYRKRNVIAFEKYGGRFLVRGGDFECVYGASKPVRVVVEFPSYEAARTCFRSPEYVEAAGYLTRGCVLDLVIIEGYDGPQP